MVKKFVYNNVLMSMTKIEMLPLNHFVSHKLLSRLKALICILVFHFFQMWHITYLFPTTFILSTIVNSMVYLSESHAITGSIF